MEKQKHLQNMPAESLHRKSFERKINKTAANLKAAEKHLPFSITKKDSQLIPSSTATKTFKKGLTLHGLLCGAAHHNSNGISESAKELNAKSQENIDARSRIPIYRNLSSTMSSSFGAESSSETAKQKKRMPLGEKKLAFNNDGKANNGSKRKLKFTEIEEKTPIGDSFEQTASPIHAVERCDNIGSTDMLNRSHTSEREEYFESALEESFDTAEREMREQTSKSFNTSPNKTFGSAGSTPIKKMSSKGQVDEGDGFSEDISDSDDGTLREGSLLSNNGTLLADLNKSVKELKEMLECANERLDTVADNLDKTLNESNLGEQGTPDAKLVRLSLPVKAKATQTVWEPNDQGRPELETTSSASKPAGNQNVQLISHTIMTGSTNKRGEHNRGRSLEKYDLRSECKQTLRRRIDVYRELTKVRLLLLEEERKYAPNSERENFVKKFRVLMEEFEKEKKRIKAELRAKGVKLETLKAHLIEIGSQQMMTGNLQSELRRLIQWRGIKQQNTQIGPSISKFSSQKQTNFERSPREKRDFAVHMANYVVTSEPPGKSGLRTDVKRASGDAVFDSIAPTKNTNNESTPRAEIESKSKASSVRPPIISPLNLAQLDEDSHAFVVQEFATEVGTSPLDVLADLAIRDSASVSSTAQKFELASKLVSLTSHSRSPEPLSAKALFSLSEHSNNSEFANFEFGGNLEKGDNQPNKHSADKEEDDNVISEQLTSTGDTSEDVTSIPYPSEAEKELVANQLEEEKENNLEKLLPSTSPRFEYQVRTEMPVQIEAVGRVYGFDTNLQVEVKEATAPNGNGDSKVEEPKSADRSVGEEVEGLVAEELAESAYGDDDSLLEEIPSSDKNCAQELTPYAKAIVMEHEQAIEVEVVSARRSLSETSSRQRTSAEIESIAEEINADSNRDASSSVFSLSASTPKQKPKQPSASPTTPKSSRPRSSRSLSGSESADKRAQDHIVAQINVDRGDSIAEEVSTVKNSSSLSQSKADIDVFVKLCNDDSVGEQSAKEGWLNGTAYNDDQERSISEAFKPSEKSLQSILSSQHSNLNTGRESVGKRRRDSASEALLKLRLMNGVPELRSPRESKSPTKTPRSPRGPERFMTKYPHKSISREASFSEEISVRGELLDELPNASQLGMVVAVLDLSHSPGTGELDVSGKENVWHLSKFSRQRKIIEQQTKGILQQYAEKGTDFGQWEFPQTKDPTDTGKEELISDDLLRQFCTEHFRDLVMTAPSNIAVRRLLRRENDLIAYLQREIIVSLIDPQRKEFCSKGVRMRAERTSHVLLDTNRLLLAQHVYDKMAIWPDPEELFETDLAVIDALLGDG